MFRVFHRYQVFGILVSINRGFQEYEVSRVSKVPRLWNANINIMDLEHISDSRVSSVSQVTSVLNYILY